MAFSFRTKKSAGIPVTRAVHRLIAQGNAARDRKDWPEAVSVYREAVQRAPNLVHIWIQLGHAEKEHGQRADAAAAYRRAAALRPDQADPLIHLGHIAKLDGDLPGAVRHYLRASRIEPDHPDALAELYRIVASTTGYTRETILELLRSAAAQASDDASSLDAALARAETALNQALAAARASETGPLQKAATLIAEARRLAGADSGPTGSNAPILVFDISDLIAFFSHSRIPTGIQRVQIEIISGALTMAERSVHICCLREGRDDWVEIPAAQFTHLAALSRLEGTCEDVSWVGALGKLLLTLALAEPFAFIRGSSLINLGSAWSKPNYFLQIRHTKKTFSIHYIQFVHDLIPIMKPEYCINSLVTDFIPWLVGMFAHADRFLVGSEATKRDLLGVAVTLQRQLSPTDVAVMALHADFRTHERQLEPIALRKWQLDGEPFVLMVGTIEPRKGHLVALDAWRDLIARYGAPKIPKLICVGRNGWLNHEIYRRLETHGQLAKHVSIISDLSDRELALLYRHCLFTIYPSFYEGWGLPVTESLCYGKPVITSDNTSLPEAGGAFAVYIETGSSAQLAAAVAQMTFDATGRNHRVDRIRTGFQPRSWTDVAKQLEASVVQHPHDPRPETPYGAPVRLGVYYPVSRLIASRIWPGIGSGEMLRNGTDWLWPEAWGCWTRPEGGTMAIPLPASQTGLCIGMLLRGLPGQDSTWSIHMEGRKGPQGTLHGNERRLVAFDHPATADGNMLQIHLRGGSSQPVRMRNGDAEREELASIGLCGFYIHETADIASRTALLEAIAFGTLDQLDAYGEAAAPAPE